MTRRYGWKPQLPDIRDHWYTNIWTPTLALPDEVDLRDKCPPVYDQGELGSCTANAIAAAHEFDQIKQGKTPFTPSRLFIYYEERRKEGTVDSDAGATIRDGMKVINTYGACNEDLWPYDTSRFSERPPAEAYTDAENLFTFLCEWHSFLNKKPDYF